jgi:hypothetical protein
MRCASNDRSMGVVSMFGVAKIVFFKVLIVCYVSCRVKSNIFINNNFYNFFKNFC